MLSPPLRKAFVLLSCTFLGLICGTLYLYSSYSPQLADRLKYSVSDSSSIALSGTLGVAISGPLAGKVVDKRGYTVALVIGGLSIVTGYLGLKKQYDLHRSNVSLSAFLFVLVGSGSTFINSTCLKCCAVSFPSIRGVATSLPLALYGLSALFYSVVASMFFPGDTSRFLGFLAYSSGIIFMVCAPSVVLCDREHMKRRQVHETIELSTVGSAPSRSVTPMPSISSVPSVPSSPAIANFAVPGRQLHNHSLITSFPFWLLFVTTGTLAALGQMYIYSVGYMVKALLAGHSDASMIQRDQQLQVGLLSVANCFGRIMGGVLGDIITQSFGRSRSWLLYLPTFGFLLTQIMGLTTSAYEALSLVSLLTGFFYGFTFCIMPLIVGDIFGMANFSYNWGIVGLAPILPSFYFTSLFGRIYDSHTVAQAGEAAVCMLGKACYNSIFELTILVSILTLVLVTVFNFGPLEEEEQVPHVA
ncbi:putative membrane protein [Meyerozyma sp. JA9]|nr:putative membrane protein [Meyerozyma sp. JA9]